MLQYPLNNRPFPQDYVERVYTGWLGKVIGVRHGGNIEGWTYEQIKRTFGEITHYLHEFKNFAADDDTNGPMAFLRALEDFTYTSDITPEQFGLTWLNYAPDGHGFFWWGGYGKSTEHTAYLNLKNGIMAPRSGSTTQNGPAVAEQIGGQIFIDVWGLIAPGNPRLAAEYAEKIASVSHDGNGKYGGMFLAACIAAAFVEQDIEQIIEAGLSVIPADCEYTRMTRSVMAFYTEHPENWEDTFHYVHENFGYHLYPGACHIIPNSAVIILSLLYGDGDFSKSINICNMCGWDTDCNVGNVGTILGVRNGLDGIDESWRKPINDFLCCSTVLGTMNIVDIPACASYIANFGYKIAGEEPPVEWRSILSGDAARFHFEYPGSTHAFCTETDMSEQTTAVIENTTEAGATRYVSGCAGAVEREVASADFARRARDARGNRSLKVLFDKVHRGHGCRVFHKTYYTPDDFNDSRYDPSFSPILYPGQTVTAEVMVPEYQKRKVQARLYVKDRNSGENHYGSKVDLTPGRWEPLRFDIPFMSGALFSETGVELIPIEGFHTNLVAYLDNFDFSGKPNYEIDFAKERLEVWNGLHIEVSQLTYLRGIWTLEDGELSSSYYGEPAEAYTGDVQWTDYRYRATVVPKVGEYHNIQFRVQGGIRSYAVGLAPNGKLALYKNNNGYTELASADFDWELGQSYFIEVEAVGNQFKIWADGVERMAYTDTDNPYLRGQVGFSNFHGSHTHYTGFGVCGV